MIIKPGAESNWLSALFKLFWYLTIAVFANKSIVIKKDKTGDKKKETQKNKMED